MKTRFFSFFIFLASLVCTLFCRVYQLLNRSEDLSAFFSSEFFCFFASAIGYAVIGVISRISRDSKNDGDAFGINKNVFAAFFSCILGVAIVLNGVTVLAGYINGFRSASPIFEGLFAVLTGPVFILNGLCYGTGKNFFKDNELLLLFPVAWGASRSINIFLDYNMVSNVAWNLSDVLATVFVSLFLLNHAKCVAKREEVKKVGHTFWYGFSAIMFIIIYITRGFVTNSGSFTASTFRGNSLGFVSSVYFVDILFVMYVVSILTFEIKEEHKKYQKTLAV